MVWTPLDSTQVRHCIFTLDKMPEYPYNVTTRQIHLRGGYMLSIGNHILMHQISEFYQNAKCIPAPSRIDLNDRNCLARIASDVALCGRNKKLYKILLKTLDAHDKMIYSIIIEDMIHK